MKRFFSLCLLLCLGLPLGGYAQRQRVESIRVAFLTADLNLSEGQAEKFWPVYNELATKRRTLHLSLKLEQEKALDPTAPEADILASIDKVMALRRQEVELLAEYLPRLKKVLSAKQLGRLVTADKRFAKQMLGGRRGQPSNGPGFGED